MMLNFDPAVKAAVAVIVIAVVVTAIEYATRSVLFWATQEGGVDHAVEKFTAQVVATPPVPTVMIIPESEPVIDGEVPHAPTVGAAARNLKDAVDPEFKNTCNPSESI